MILILLIILWLLFANTVWCFLIPVSCLFIRAAYRERSIKLFKVYPIIFASLLFILNYFLANKPFNDNLILSLRIVAFSGLLIHLFESLENGSFKLFSKLEYSIYYGIRLFTVIVERFSDTFLVLGTRWHSTSFFKKTSLITSTFSNFMLEATLVSKQINLVTYEKGGINTSSEWNFSRPKLKSLGPFTYSFIGDVFLILLLFIPSFVVGEKIIPEKINIVLDFFKSIP